MIHVDNRSLTDNLSTNVYNNSHLDAFYSREVLIVSKRDSKIYFYEDLCGLLNRGSRHFQGR